MRTLFASEKRCVSNLINLKWGKLLHTLPSIVSEYIDQSANCKIRPSFNCNFSLNFVDPRTASFDTAATMSPVLPNTLGAELFLVVERDTTNPIRLELLGGDAFPLRHYTTYVDIIETSIREAIRSRTHPFTSALSTKALTNILMRKAAFARLLVVGCDATFLYFPNETTPIMRGKCFTIAHDEDTEIYCYIDGDIVVCFDGWLRVKVTPTEQTLAALPISNRAIAP